MLTVMTGLPDFWTSGLLDFWTSSLPVFQSSGLLITPHNSIVVLFGAYFCPFSGLGEKGNRLTLQPDYLKHLYE
jgi:hypothetical protein